MTNQVLLIGRLVSGAEKEENTENWHCRLKTEEEENRASYELCFSVWPDMAHIINERFPEGSVCGLRGYLKQEDGKLVLMAERISFLSVEKQA